MMRCWIAYSREDLETNGFFAERMAEHGRDLGMDVSVVVTDDLPSGIPDIMINRSRDWALAKRMESQGTAVFNSSEVSRISNDKFETYRLADRLGVPHMECSLPGERLPAGPPWVVKSRTGHGGTEVFLTYSERGVAELCGTVDDPLVQSTADLGRDMRVYVLDGKVLAAVMRSSDRDFRANYKLGGSIELCEPTPDVERMVEAVCSELRPTMVGIDFVFSDGKALINEIEDAVGTRMLYSLTELDPARLLMETVHSKMSL